MATKRPSSKTPGSMAQGGPLHVSEDVPPKKKAKPKSKATAGVSRSTKGKLAGLLNLPIDIFAEVTSHLMPLDLLYLGRASKLLRAILMSNSARSMWIASRKNVPGFGKRVFPDCPPDLSEPEYAHIVFDKGCMGCTSSHAYRVELVYRMRSCKPCVDPMNNQNQGDFARLCNTSEELTPEISKIYRLIPREEYGWSYFPVNAIRAYNQCMVQKARSSPTEYAQYLDKRVGMMGVIKQHGRDLENWHEAYLQDQRYKQSDIEKERRKLIVARLLEAGWDARDFPQRRAIFETEFWSDRDNYNLWGKLVFQSKPLTDRTWKSIKPQLEEIISFNQSKRLEQEKRHRINELRSRRRKEIHPFYDAFVEEESTDETWGLYPIGPEIEGMPCIDTLLRRIDLKSPLSADGWNGILDLLRRDIQDYQATFRVHLARLVRVHLEQAHEMGETNLYIRGDKINTQFLTKDPSRMTFTSSRYPGVEKPFPAILAEERRWKLLHQVNSGHRLTPAQSVTAMAVNIEDYGKFDLVNNVWT